MTCDLCPAKAFADHQWGSALIKTQTATLCEECGRRLWDSLRANVTNGTNWYRVDSPGKLKP